MATFSEENICSQECTLPLLLYPSVRILVGQLIIAWLYGKVDDDYYIISSKGALYVIMPYDYPQRSSHFLNTHRSLITTLSIDAMMTLLTVISMMTKITEIT